jgi:glucose 1-dehydrogenase
MKTRYAMIGLGRNNVAPGAIATPINKAWLHDPARRKQVWELIPSRRIGQLEEVAGAVLSLVSNEAADDRHDAPLIDGGMTLYASFLGQAYHGTMVTYEYYE